MRRLAIGLVSGALILAACGDDDTESSADTVAPTEAPAATDAPEPAAEPAAEEPAPAPAEEPAAEPEAAEPEPAPEPAEPEPTTTLAPEPAPAPVGGRELGTSVRPESAAIDNPLPDLLVDDVRRGVQANTANILPSERPVLVWAWAPH